MLIVHDTFNTRLLSTNRFIMWKMITIFESSIKISDDRIRVFSSGYCMEYAAGRLLLLKHTIIMKHRLKNNTLYLFITIEMIYFHSFISCLNKFLEIHLLQWVFQMFIMLWYTDILNKCYCNFFPRCRTTVTNFLSRKANNIVISSTKKSEFQIKW